MISFFDPSSGDYSIGYLVAIFGTMNGVLTSSTGDTTVFGAMFQTFNSIILMVGAVIVVYTTIVGVLMTANEGEFMGKKWGGNSIWIPIRMVIGIATLIPTGSGYSAIQLIFMWIIVQGIGAADTLWSTVLNYTEKAGSVYKSMSVPTVGSTNSLSQLFQGVVCDVSTRGVYQNSFAESGAGAYYCQNKTNPFCGTAPAAFNPAQTTYSMGPNSNCGTLTTCDKATQCADSSSLACYSCTAQIESLAQIIPTFQGIAKTYVDADNQYLNYYTTTLKPVALNAKPPEPPSWLKQYCNDKGISNCRGANLPDDPGLGTDGPPTATIQKLLWPYAIKPVYGDKFMDTAVQYYNDSLQGALTKYISEQASDNAGLKNKWLSDAQTRGWILAGAYYYYLAAFAGEQTQASFPQFTITNDPPPSVSALKDVRNNYKAGSVLLEAAAGSAAGSLSSLPGGGGGFSTANNEALKSMNDAFQKTTAGATSKIQNPLVDLAIGGTVLLVIAETLFGTFVVLTFALGIPAFLSAYVFGTGIDNPAGPTVGLIYFAFVPIFLSFLAWLVSLGGMLAVYLPMVPYMIFTFGAISWFIQVIEAMVAGPLVAIGILSPSGQHELMGKSEQAIMMIFYAFLRPSLMIFGLIAAMFLAFVVKSMIDAAFWPIVYQTVSRTSGSSAILSTVLFITSYVFFVITGLNKAFAAIYLIPQHVMGWIGGQHAARDAGEAGGVEEMKGGFQKAAGGAAGVMGAADASQPAGRAKGAQEGFERSKKAKEEKEALGAKTENPKKT